MALIQIKRIRFNGRRSQGRGKVIHKSVPNQTGTRTIRHSPAGKIIR